MSISGSSISGAPISGSPATAGALTLHRLAAGRDPHLILDWPGGCLRQELQLFHFVDGAGLRRRSEADRFLTPHLTPETADENLAIEDVVRTTDRRISVIYSERDPVLGTYELHRIDSTPYPVAKAPPEAPVFVTTNAAYIPFYRGSFWNDVGSPVTQTKQIALVVRAGTVHGVELECADVFPAGFQPPIWTQQIQDYTPGGVLGAGHLAAFSINLTHGGNSLTPCAFRARCRDDSDPLNPCYSAWRYYLAGYWDPTEVPVASYTLLGNDACICPTPLSTRIAGGRLVTFTTEQYFIGGNIFGCNPPCRSATGFPTAGGFIRHWLYRRRATMPVSFTDESLKHFGFVLYSIEANSQGEGAPIVSLSGDQSPLDFE